MPEAQATAPRPAASRTPRPRVSVGGGRPSPRHPRGAVRATLVTLRPRQWIKNTLAVAAAGAAAAPVALSRWFILVVTCAAVFVAAGKRHAELRRLVVEAVALAGRRRVLERYTIARLRVIMLISAVVAVAAYVVWAFEMPVIHGFPWRP